MALQVSLTRQLMEQSLSPKVGDIMEYGCVMKVEKVTVQDFILMAIAGGAPMYGYDIIAINEDFVTTSPDDEGVGEIVSGMVTLIWLNELH
jgi:hypothetical protein